MIIRPPILLDDLRVYEGQWSKSKKAFGFGVGELKGEYRVETGQFKNGRLAQGTRKDTYDAFGNEAKFVGRFSEDGTIDGERIRRDSWAKGIFNAGGELAGPG